MNIIRLNQSNDLFCYSFQKACCALSLYKDTKRKQLLCHLVLLAWLPMEQGWWPIRNYDLFSGRSCLWYHHTLWTVWFVFPMVSSIQKCAQGLVWWQVMDLQVRLKRNYPRAIVIMMILFQFPAIVLNIGADIAGMGAVMNMMYPVCMPEYFHWSSRFFWWLWLFIYPTEKLPMFWNGFVWTFAVLHICSFFISSRLDRNY